MRHTLWAVRGADRDALVGGFRRIPALYIADGHHRAASAARARDDMRTRGAKGTSIVDETDATSMLAVAFPHDQVQILRKPITVRDSAPTRHRPRRLRARFTLTAGPATPASRGDIAFYFEREWRTLRPRTPLDRSDPIASLDVSVLQDQLLAPVLNIVDVRTDKRIDFISGARGTGWLERLVDSGQGAAAFSLFPVSVADLMAASDAGAIMPPKSTWFEPKLRTAS